LRSKRPTPCICHEPDRSGLALAHRQTVHIIARRRGPDRDAGPLSIYRLYARRPGVQIFGAMRAHGVLLSVVLPALPFAGVGCELGRSSASLDRHLFDQPDLPHFSAALRRDRADLLERIVVLSFLHRLLGSAEIVGDSGPGAGRLMDDSGRTDILHLPALHSGADIAGDAIAPRRRGAGARLSRLVHRHRYRAP
jgi:hypothetical protein